MLIHAFVSLRLLQSFVFPESIVRIIEIMQQHPSIQEKHYLLHKKNREKYI